MTNINVNIQDAKVIKVKEFVSRMGYGVDFDIVAQGNNCTVYFQVVTYDNSARSYHRLIHEGDHVRVTGELKDKPFKKSDGTDGHSLTIERPDYFRKILSSSDLMQLQQHEAEDEFLSLEELIERDREAKAAATERTNAVTATAGTANDGETSQAGNEIILTEEIACTAQQELHAESAINNQEAESIQQIPQGKPIDYEDLSDFESDPFL